MENLKKYRFGIFLSLIILTFVCFELYNHFQNRSMEHRLQQLNSKTVYSVKEDTTIYRISKDEFESIVNEDVQNQLNRITSEVFKWLSVVISSVLAILAFFGIKELNRSINDKIGVAVRERIEKEYQQIKGIQGSFEEKIEEIIRNVKLKAEKEQGFFMNALALKIEIDDALEHVSRDSSDYKLKLNSFRQKLSNLSLEDDEMKKSLLEKVFLFVYKSRMDNDMNTLRDEYKDRFKFNYITWANIAIANMNMYESYNAEINKKYAFEACEKALELLPGYGDAYAVMLIIFAIDLKRNAKVKREDITDLFHEINYGSDSTPAFETCNYLNRLTDRWVQYIDLLRIEFPDEMKLMYASFQPANS
jgi:hypothetical protein